MNDAIHGLHFAVLSIDEIKVINADLLPMVFEANRLSFDGTPDDVTAMRRLALFDKFFWLHMHGDGTFSCGQCETLLTDGQRCTHCNVYRYCDRAYQSNHWRQHRPFCALMSREIAVGHKDR